MTGQIEEFADRFNMEEEEFIEFFTYMLDNISDNRDFLIDIYNHFRILGTKEDGHQNGLQNFYDSEPYAHVFVSLGDLIQYDQHKDELVNLVGEDQAEDILDVWHAAQWSRDATQAYNEQLRGAEYWTQKSIDFVNEPGEESMVHVTKMWGLDEVYDMTVPLDLFLYDAVTRVNEVNEWWSQLEEGEYPRVYEEDIERIEQLPDTLREIADELEENIGNHQYVDGSPLRLMNDE